MAARKVRTRWVTLAGEPFPEASQSPRPHDPFPQQARRAARRAGARRLGYAGPTVSPRRVHCEQLPNGLTVVLHETDTAPVAEFQLWARAGSADERDDERGLAHFHEHMLFKGTERRGLGEIAGEVEGSGGRINAYTSHDVTVYHATTPADAFATGVDVL